MHVDLSILLTPVLLATNRVNVMARYEFYLLDVRLASPDDLHNV